jgi:bacitracin synthase 3
LYAQDPGNAAFNICCRYHWDQELDAAIVNRVIAELVERHDNLRAHFEPREGRFVQLVRRSVPVEVALHDLRGLYRDAQERALSDLCQAEERIPFRLETPPLHRLHLVHHGKDESELLWTMHHIISDGWSMNVLEREFRHLYQRFLEDKDNDLQPVALQFTDLALWQSQLLYDHDKVSVAKAYWAGVLRPPLRPLPLPYDFERSKSSVGRRSAGYRAVIDEETTAGLRQLAKEQKTGLFMVLFTGFNRLLAEFTETEDIVTAIPSANRYQHELKDTVGFLVDSAIVRNRIDLDMPVEKSLRQVNAATLRSMDHAYYPIELACEAAGTTWSEILSTFFNMSTFGDTNRTMLADTGWRALEQVQNAKLEVVFYLTEYKNGVEVAVHYYTDLFLPATIENLTKRYAAILEEMTHEPVWRKVSEFEKRSEPIANVVV